MTVVSGAVAGFVGGFIASGGDLKAGGIGATTGAAFAGVGNGFDALAETGASRASLGFFKALAHGAVGGISSKLAGTKFRYGALSAGFTQSISGPISNIPSDAGRIVAAAVAGGASASVGGGKFANGAVTGAFSRLFNDAVHGDLRSYDPDDPSYHIYSYETEICGLDEAWCTERRVFDGIRLYPAPGYDKGSPVRTGDVTNVEILGFGGVVHHFVDEPSLTVYNITEPGHSFDPGYVSRSVVTRGNSIYVLTIGEGTGSYRAVNIVGAPIAFKPLDYKIRSYVRRP